MGQFTHRRYLFLWLGWLLFSGAHGIIYRKDNSIVIDTRIDTPTDLLNTYQNLITHIPLYFQDAIDNHMLVSIIIPDDIEGVGPLEDHAPYIEGARTTLAWLQAYKKIFLEHAISCQIIKESQLNKDEILFFEDIWPLEEQSLIINLGWQSDTSKKCFIITGGAGFIGSHLVRKILDLGHRVIAIDNLICSTGENISEFKNNPDFTFIRHDVSIPFELTCRVDYVIHAASIPSPADYYELPRQTMEVGIHGTLNTLHIAHSHNARYLFLSTSEVYGDPEVHPQVESYAGNVNCSCARSPYDQSKRAAETLIKLYYEKYNLDIRIARIFNTYGPGMRLHDGRVVTNFIAALLEDKPLVIYGDGTQTRSLCYVDDLVEGLYSLLITDCFSIKDTIGQRVFNVGNPEEYTISKIAEHVQDFARSFLNIAVRCRHIENPDKADPHKRQPDISKAYKILGFKPRVNFRQGLEKTYNYFAHKYHESH